MTQCLKLIDRLRGVYTLPVDVKHGLLDGKDTFTRDFSKTTYMPAEWFEAADMIEQLYHGNTIDKDKISCMMDKVSCEKDWLGMGLKPYCAPIGLEAYQTLKSFLEES